MNDENENSPAPDLVSLPPELAAFLCAFLATRDIARLQSAFAGQTADKARFRLAINGYLRTGIKKLDRNTMFGEGDVDGRLDDAAMLSWHFQRCAHLANRMKFNKLRNGGGPRNLL